MEILSKLGLNGKILLAQLLNFFLLLYVLKRFLYSPLLKIMKERDEKIREGIENSIKSQLEMEKTEEKIKKRISQANTKADVILAQAHKEGKEQKEELVRKAKEEINKWKEEAKNAIMSEKKKIVEEIRQEISPLIVEVSQKFIKAKASKEEKEEWIKEINSAIKDMKK